MDSKKYIHFSTLEFIEDREFRNWVRNNEADDEWIQFQKDHPSKQSELAEARSMLLKIITQYQDQQLSPALIESEWGNFTQPSHKAPLETQSQVNKSQWPIWSIAAALLLMISVGLWIYTSDDAEPMYLDYHTEAGEIQQIVLPDSTHITLNANSSLILPQAFDIEKPRRVQLDGEGYFEVTPAANPGNAFVVETDKSSIQVLGTTFNAKSNDHKVSVALVEGKVRFHYISTENKKEYIDILPGHHLTLDDNRKITSYADDNIAQYGQWTEGYFVYDKADVSDILADLEHQFSIEFAIQDSELKSRKVNGVLSATSLEEALEVIKILLDVEINSTQDSIIEITNQKN